LAKAESFVVSTKGMKMQPKFYGNINPNDLQDYRYMTLIPYREDPVQFARDRAALKRQIFANRQRKMAIYVREDNSFDFILKVAIDYIPTHVNLPADELDEWLDDLLA
jgi:hypothetical protein